MDNTKHTPGPWEYVPSTENHGAYICGPWGSTVCDCYTMTVPGPFNGWKAKPVPFHGEAMDANARLIAAAPDLLAALKDLLAYVEGVYGDHESSEGETARAAIAKAEGRKDG